ncbi:MAG: pyridine nucleotide-disulfide oxidoreductase, partial [Rhodospirillales bacterium]|nr:pyridine nucleotide-disulfide oxidoreductase [Rhodospirillales bacterium]
MSIVMNGPVLAHGMTIAELYERDGLTRLDGHFLTHLSEADTALHGRLLAARQIPPPARDEAALLVALAPHVEDFVAQLFGIRAEMQALAARHHDLAPLFACKRLFVQRRALKAYGPAAAEGFDGGSLSEALEARFGEPLTEASFSRHVMAWMDHEKDEAEMLDLAARYAAWALHTAPGRFRHAGGALFSVPGKHDPLHLVPGEVVEVAGVPALGLPHDLQRRRQGFDLTDRGTDLRGALDQVHYCILCHHQGKDSCSKGMPDKKGEGRFARNPLGTAMTGCPLEEKISEMHEVKGQGLAVSALAMAVVDNPMVAGTGHRICNDCMAACIYQNQLKDPVDIPQAETRTLKDVLALPWGFEIYSLLTRWNPLNLRRPLPRPESGRSVLVVGLGPAGYTLAYHLMQDGHTVVAVDGLKIEPLPPELSGVAADGRHVPFHAIRDIQELLESLGQRVNAGFGGVAEYGITVRWDKNFLKIIRLLLERRGTFAMFGGVRFGGTLTAGQAFAMGFDHIALCMG